MITMREWFAAFTEKTGERPTHVVFGSECGWNVKWEGVAEGDVIAFDDVPDAILDRQFDDGYGGNETPNLCAWSPSWVIFSSDYDGSEDLNWVPRSPLPHQPIRPGGC